MSQINQTINEQKFHTENLPQETRKLLYNKAASMARIAMEAEKENITDPRFDSENEAIEHYYEQIVEVFNQGYKLGHSEASPESGDDDDSGPNVQRRLL